MTIILPPIRNMLIKRCSPVNSLTRTFFLPLIFLLATATTALAQESKSPQEKDAAYTKVVTERAAKIVATLDIGDASKALRVRNYIASQYRSLNDIQSDRDIKIKAAKQAITDKEALATEIKKIEAQANSSVDKLHSTYLAKLSSELTPEQVDKVKDGMTYSVLPITYNGYMQMLPDLTEQQKKQIMLYLVEAREHAMDAESSEKKHGWFGKYKGRINNYLSAAGYDMKKAGEEWQKRLKAEQSASSLH